MVTIESGIPIPEPRMNKYPWEQMKVGDSFTVTKGRRPGVLLSAKTAGVKITVRKENNLIRVWLIGEVEK